MPKANALADLDYLPLPNAARAELRHVLVRQRGWPRYRAEHDLTPMRMTRAQWFAAAIALDVDVEKLVLDYYERTGALFKRAAHLDGTGIKKSATNPKNPDFWS